MRRCSQLRAECEICDTERAVVMYRRGRVGGGDVPEGVNGVNGVNGGVISVGRHHVQIGRWRRVVYSEVEYDVDTDVAEYMSAAIACTAPFSGEVVGDVFHCGEVSIANSVRTSPPISAAAGSATRALCKSVVSSDPTVAECDSWSASS